MGAQISSLSNWPCVIEEHVEIDCQKISLNSYKTCEISSENQHQIKVCFIYATSLCINKPCEHYGGKFSYLKVTCGSIPYF